MEAASTAPTQDLVVRIVSERDTTVHEAELMVQSLRRTMLKLPVHGVERMAEPAPPGTKSGGGQVSGLLIVTLVVTQNLLLAVVGLVREWLRGKQVQAVRFELNGQKVELLAGTTRQQDEVLRLAEKLSGEGHQPG